MSKNFFNPFTDDTTVFNASSMNLPFESFDEAITYMKNIIITCDGDIIANSVTGNFSFTGNLRILFGSPINGNLISNIIQSALIKMDLGDCLYADLNNVNETNINLVKVKLTAGTAAPILKNRVLIAYRNNANGEIYMANTLQKVVNGGGSAFTERIVPLAENTAASTGKILCLTASGKYALADHSAIETTLDLVMVKSAGIGEATVIESGLMTVVADFIVGDPIYLGTTGNFTQIAPSESGSIVKCVGWAVDTNAIKFKPDSLGIQLI